MQATLAQQTAIGRVPRMRSMQSEQAHQEDDGEMIEMNIKAFLEATRIYLQQLIPAQQPALATIPVRQRH